MKWFSVLTLAALCAACNGGAPAGNAVAGSESAAAADAGRAPAADVGRAPASAEALRPAAEPASAVVGTRREVTVPAGTSLRLELKSPVGSDSSHVEDAIRATLRQPLVVGGQTVVPAGTELTGVVSDVKQAGRIKGRARVALRFTALHLGGERYDIRTATIAEQARATKGSDAKKIAIGAGAGAALGALLGGGSGAAKGAAIGGAGGTGVVLATRGKEVRLGVGAPVTTRLTAPIAIRVRG